MKRNTPIRLLLLSGACLCICTTALSQETGEPVAEVQDVEDEVSRQQTVVVRGQYIPDEKRSTSEVSSLIDSDDFQVTGDSDAAAALARVAGISTADSKFIFVRGLNERYSNATLNGSPLPSPAPLRRVAPLDLFPTSALESINVQKTYSPEKSAEFGGGTVDIRTKGVPNEGFFNIGFDVAYDTNTSLQSGLLHDGGGDSDFLGIDDGSRDLPSLAEGLTPEFGRALTDNSSLLVQQTGDVPLDSGVSLTGGQRFDFDNDTSVGILGSLGYSSSWETREGTRGFGVQGSEGLIPFFQRTRSSTASTTDINGLAVIGVEFLSDHEVTFTGLLSRSTEKETRQIIGETADENIERDDALEWFERQLWTTQISGEHYFPALADLEVNWRASYSEALRDAPFQVATSYALDDASGDFILQTTGSDNQITFSRVEDDTTDFGIDFLLPIERGGDCTFFCEIDLKAGYAYVENDRFAESNIFGILGLTPELRGLRLDFAYASLFNGGGGAVQLVQSNAFPPEYLATLEIDAGYLGVDLQITPFIRAAIGGRYEDGIQAIDTLLGQNDPGITEVANEQSDFLPAFTLTWNPIEDLQVRGGYSKTLTRPQFRELAPTQFVNTETDQNFVGNPFLTNAEIENYDIRAEYYFSRGQFLTFGVFYKDLVSPIEEIQIFSADAVRTEFINAPSAELWGFEIEYEQELPLDTWLEWDFMEDRDVTIKANYTWSDSEVGTDGFVTRNTNNFSPLAQVSPAAGQIREGRALQGQSEHLFNLQLLYSNLESGFDASVLYNFTSERIRAAGAPAGGGIFLEDVIEDPPSSLDIVITKLLNVFGNEYEIQLSAENILGDGYEAFQDDGTNRVFVDTFDQGTNIQFGIKRSF